MFISDFELLREQEMKEAGGMVRLWRHRVTGAEVLTVANDDENKCFGVSFRTPPKNSTGVAHILEHSVLCGSEKYPVKEPFVELLKSSLQTFLNALTFPDKTCYPVASANLQDFYNLMDVYLDAVFYPRIDEDVLRQEGWHIAAAAEQGEDRPWEYKGVVYNEMKGVYSSPDSVLMEESQHAVFPDTLYSLDSGGRPEDILKLSYPEFKDFHSAYYHPSNARFFFWGDDPEDERLLRLAAVLKPFSARRPDSSVPLQPRLEVERKIEVPYEAPEGEEPQAHVTVSWLLCESEDSETLFLLEMLEHILIALPGSPLRKALMDSGLGEDLSGAGLETDLRQAYFSIGLRSVEAESRIGDQVERIIMECLAELAEEGVPHKAVEAALNSLEFDLRENNTGRFPRGLAAMFRALSTWNYDGDPMAPLAWEEPLARVKARLAGGEAVFEDLLRRWFLENTHRVQVMLLPDPALAEARLRAEREKLEAEAAAMSAEEKRQVEEISARLKAAQEAPDSPEALATIPSLGLDALPGRIRSLPLRAEADAPLITHELDTTGILYAHLLLPLNAVPERLLPLVPLYARALTEMGTKKRDYVDLGLELAAHTGSLDAVPQVQSRLADAGVKAWLCLHAKATRDKLPRLRGLLEEVLQEQDFSNAERFAQIVLEEKARVEQSLVPSGHGVVAGRMGSWLSAAGHVSELMGGVDYYEYLKALSPRLKEDWPGVKAELEELRRLIIRKDGGLLDLAGDAGLLEAARDYTGLLEALPGLNLQDEAWSLLKASPRQAGAEALLVPAQVNYVGLGLNLREQGYVYHGSATVVLRHIRMGYLWDRVRVQGGAYGAFANYNRAVNALSFLSYRDPNVERTLNTYAATADYLGNLTLPREDVVRAIVGAIGDMDAYLLPSAKASTALWRHLMGESEAGLQRIREEILGATLADFHRFGEVLAAAQGVPCALGGNAVKEYAVARGWQCRQLL